MSDRDLSLENETKNNTDFRIYEVGYLLLPTIEGSEVPAVYSNLKDLLTSLGGEIISDEMPKSISLAYTMTKVISNKRNKFNTAYFGWVKFYMDTDKILDLKKHLTLDPNFLRFLILKTVKENTIASKRFIHKDVTRRKMPVSKKGENEVVVPIDKEEIDKEIDAMVAV